MYSAVKMKWNGNMTPYPSVDGIGGSVQESGLLNNSVEASPHTLEAAQELGVTPVQHHVELQLNDW